MGREARPECVLKSESLVGEGALWDVQEQVLWWLDIKGRLIHRYDPSSGANRSWPTPDDIGSLAVRAKGGLVVAMGHGFHFFDPATGGFALITAPEADQPANRFNDGKPDRQGRFWAGSLHDPETSPTGGLYCLGLDLRCRKLVDGITASNALAFGRDSTVVYYGDSAKRCVWAFDFDPAEGNLRNRRIFLECSPQDGAPDGAAVDSDDCYWVAHPEGWCVARYDPRGKRDRIIPTPVERPSCVAFGGPQLRTLYITSMRWGMSAQALASQPLAGSLFAVDAGVAGLPDSAFAG